MRVQPSHAVQSAPACITYSRDVPQFLSLTLDCCAAAGNQTNLAHLKMAANMLSGTIPSTLCTLGALETLNMSANSLTGVL